MKKAVSAWAEKIRAQLDQVSTQEVGAAVSSNVRKAWGAAGITANDASSWLSSTDWIKNLNETYTSAVSKAMDAGFKIGATDLETGLPMTPNNHRILDGGHSLFKSFTHAADIGSKGDQGNMDTFIDWAKAYVTDLSSNAGMPIPGAESIYGFLRNTMNISEETARDLVTVNGQEAINALLGGSIAALALYFSWKDNDKARFSEAIGSIGLGSLIALNPAAALVALVAIAAGYNKQMIDIEGVKRGGLVSLVGFGVSALIPGPVLVGAIPAIVISIYINKKLDKNVPVSEQFGKAYAYMKSPEFIDTISSGFAHAANWVDEQTSSLKKAA